MPASPTQIAEFIHLFVKKRGRNLNYVRNPAVKIAWATAAQRIMDSGYTLVELNDILDFVVQDNFWYTHINGMESFSDAIFGPSDKGLIPQWQIWRDARLRQKDPTIFDQNCPICHGSGQERREIDVVGLAKLTLEDIDEKAKKWELSPVAKQRFIDRMSWAKQCVAQKTTLQYEMLTCPCGTPLPKQ